MARKKPTPEPPSPARVAEMAQEILAKGAVRTTALGLSRLPSAMVAQVREQLSTYNLEWTGKSVRVALEAQILGALETTSLLALKDLKPLLRGAGPLAEIQSTIRALQKKGLVVRVMRQGKEHLGMASREALSADELADLSALASQLQKALRPLAKGKAQGAKTLWRPEVAAMMPGWMLEPTPDPVETAILESVGTLSKHGLPLAFVPDLVKTVEPSVAGPEVKRALLALATRGVLELRPESGVGLLSPQEAALCPVGPDGRPLSYVRRI